MAVTVVTSQQRDGSKHASISQSAAASAEEWVAAPPADQRLIITEVCLGISADGTAIFLSGTTARTGAIPVVATGGLHLVGTEENPVFECAESEAFNVTSATGALRGYIKYAIRAN